jgi:hypothetical protein
MSLRDDLKAYLDGELAPERMAEMRDAIDRDPALAREAEELASIGRGLRSAEVYPAAVGLEDTLKALEHHQRRPFWVWIAPVAVAASALVFMTISVRRLAEGVSSPESVVYQDAVGGYPSEGPVFRKGQSMESVAAPLDEPTSPGAALEKRSPKMAAGNVRTVKERDLSAPPRVPPRPRFRTELPSGSAASETAKGGQAQPLPPGKPPMARTRSTDAVKGAPMPASPSPERPPGIAVDGGMAAAEMKEGPLVIEVDSLAEAEVAIRDLAVRTGMQVVEEAAPAAKLGAQATQALQDALPRTRRLVLDVEEDRAGGIGKQVTEAIRAARLRRDSQTQISASSYSGRQQGGGAQGGAAGGQADAPRSQGGVPQGAQGGGFGGSEPAPAATRAKPPVGQDRSRRYTVNKATKPRRRVEIVLRVRDETTPGKIQE